MSTHVRKCVVCRTETYCSNDTHALGCGGSCSDPEEQAIEFCSEECFKWLEKAMKDRWQAYQEVLAGW